MKRCLGPQQQKKGTGERSEEAKEKERRGKTQADEEVFGPQATEKASKGRRQKKQRRKKDEEKRPSKTEAS